MQLHMSLILHSLRFKEVSTEICSEAFRIWFMLSVLCCSHLMENQIGNVERGAFDDLKELERLWEHTHTHMHI